MNPYEKKAPPAFKQVRCESLDGANRDECDFVRRAEAAASRPAVARRPSDPSESRREPRALEAVDVTYLLAGSKRNAIATRQGFWRKQTFDEVLGTDYRTRGAPPGCEIEAHV